MVSGKIVFVLFEIQVNVFISNKSIIAQRIHIKCGADKRILRIYGTSFALSELSEFGTADWTVRARGSTHSILKFSRVWMALTCSACVLPRYIEICQQQQQKWARIGIISIGSSSTMCMRTEPHRIKYSYDIWNFLTWLCSRLSFWCLCWSSKYTATPIKYTSTR